MTIKKSLIEDIKNINFELDKAILLNEVQIKRTNTFRFDVKLNQDVKMVELAEKEVERLTKQLQSLKEQKALNLKDLECLEKWDGNK